MSIDTLDHQFAIKDHITFIEDENGLTKISISNSFAEAEVYLFGGHITHYKPHDHAPILWMSPDALFSPPKAIRGGVPICWPWFGKDARHPQRPQHGFARNHLWELYKTAALDNGETQLRLQLHDNSETRELWPHSFELELCVTVGKRLRMELISKNTDTNAYTIGAALHTYFHVDDINTTLIEGLEGVTYIDTTDEYKKKVENSPIKIDREVDRIYLDTQDTCIITDRSRKIEVQKAQSTTTVVWNPWIEKAQAMKDFSDDGYREMLCIESVNTLEDSIYLEPGQSHTLMQSITHIEST